MLMTNRTTRVRVGPLPYEWLDLTGVRLDAVLTGTRGVTDLRNTASRLGYPHRCVTSALTRFGRIHVIQLGGDPTTGTVTLSGTSGAPVTVTLPHRFWLLYAESDRVRRMLARIEADCPPGSLTAILATSLLRLYDECAKQRRHHRRTVSADVIENCLAGPLLAFGHAWGSLDPDTAPDATDAGQVPNV
jgi:hypothetical protein